MKTIQAVDLFCGAGGTSHGFLAACRQKGVTPHLMAINHSPVAIASHRANHPGVEHLCWSIEGLCPRTVVPAGRLDLLMASPECIYHSRARGTGPCNPQSRNQADDVLRWIDELTVDRVLLENVREWVDWGPLDSTGRPIRSRRGEYFRAFVGKLRERGYSVESRLLCAADYGAATSRTRLFLQARRDGTAIRWPARTHAPRAEAATLGLKPWRGACEVIDWSLPCPSIFLTAADAKAAGLNVKRPLAEKSMRRIAAGLKRYVLDCQEPYIAPIRHGLVVPHVSRYFGGVVGADPRDPLPTVTTTDHHALVAAFMTRYFGTSVGSGCEAPVGAVCTSPGHTALTAAWLQKYHGGDRSERVHQLGDPLRTVDTSNRFGLVAAFLAKYYGTGENASACDEPMATVTTRDRFSLVTVPINGETYAICDIGMRMLQGHELARAQGFPEGFSFCGSSEQIVAQIGNAVEVHQALALCREMVA